MELSVPDFAVINVELLSGEKKMQLRKCGKRLSNKI